MLLLSRLTVFGIRQIITVQDDGLHREAMASVEPLCPFVRGVRGDRRSLCAAVHGPRKKTMHESFPGTAASMFRVDVDALQFRDPDRVHAARSIQACDQVTDDDLAIAGDEDQAVVAGEE